VRPVLREHIQQVRAGQIRHLSLLVLRGMYEKAHYDPRLSPYECHQIKLAYERIMSRKDLRERHKLAPGSRMQVAKNPDHLARLTQSEE
jgi:hypothetical protein